MFAGCLLAGSTLASIGAEISSFGRFIDSLPVQSWVERRDTGLTKQRFDYSCGAASLVSVLKYEYGVAANELDIIDRIGLKEAFSMADLARVAEEYGFKAVGLAINYEMLMLFRRPVIVYLDYWDDGHFSVLRAIDEHGVWLADPAWGNVRMRRERFENFWKTRNDPETPGRALVVFPSLEDNMLRGDTVRLPIGGSLGIVPPHIVGY